MVAGSKSKYDPNTFPLLAEGFAREGLNDKEICRKLGISIQSFYTYQKKYLEFFESVKRGKAPVDVKIENSLLKRALGYSYEEKTTEVRIDEEGNAKPVSVKTIKKEIPPDTGAIAFWLKNRKPEEWRDRQDVKLDGEIKTRDLDFYDYYIKAEKTNGND